MTARVGSIGYHSDLKWEKKLEAACSIRPVASASQHCLGGSLSEGYTRCYSTQEWCL